MTLCGDTPHLDEVPPGQRVSEHQRFGETVRRWGLHIQDITAKGRLLIPNGLLHVLLPMPDLVTLSARPSLVALGFGLGVQLFRSGSSTHREAGQERQASLPDGW